jgi:hypothetical protein
LGPKPEDVRSLFISRKDPHGFNKKKNHRLLAWLKSRSFTKMDVFTGKSKMISRLSRELSVPSSCAGPKPAYWAENKHTLRELADSLSGKVLVPPGKNLHSVEELKAALDFLQYGKDASHAFVIKTTQGASGLLSTLVKNKTHLRRFVKSADQNFLKNTVFEKWIESDRPSPSINFYLHRTGRAQHLFISDQMFESHQPDFGEEGTRIHRGNRYPTCFGTVIQNRILENAKPLLKALFKGGYWGPVGFDAIVTRRGQVYITEINPRVTGPHYGFRPMKLLQKKCFYMQNEKIDARISFGQLEERLRDVLFSPSRKDGLIIFNFFPGKFIGLIVADQKKRMEKLIDEVSARLESIRFG